MALDDPNITKILFEHFGEQVEVEIAPGEVARLACVMLEAGKEPYVEIIDCAPGIYTIEAKKRDIPKKVWFETILRKSFLPRKIRR